MLYDSDLEEEETLVDLKEGGRISDEIRRKVERLKV
jgi:hypothetical protein